MPHDKTDHRPEAEGDQEFIRLAAERYKKAREHNGKWKKRTRRNYDFYAGRQWSDEETALLGGQGKAAVVMNRIKPRVSAVVGMEISNRQELRYQPREKGDDAMTELINKASEWTRDQAETEDEETSQFQDMVITGYGWATTLMDYSINPDGIASVQRMPALKHDWDPDARQANLTDMEFFFYTDDISKEQFKAMGFPIGKARGGALGFNETIETAQPHNDTGEEYYPNEVPAYPGAERGGPLKKVRIVRYEYIKREDRWLILMPDSSTRMIDPAKRDGFESMALEMGYADLEFTEFDSHEEMVSGGFEVPEGRILSIPYVKQVEKRYRRAWISGDELLRDEENPYPHSFTEECMTGWLDEMEGTFFGMVDGLIDPQEWSNKFLSQAIYIYTVNPKGGAYVKRRAVENPADFETKFASPDAVQWMKDNADLGADILEKRPGQYPSDLDKLTTFAIDSLPAIDGLTPEVMGQVARDQPGILENMRKQASMTILAPLFNAKRRYHKRQGRVLLHYIAQFFTSGQLARIAGGQINPEILQQLRSLDVRNYDVIVDDAPSSPNNKEYNLNILMEVIRQAPGAAAALSPILVKNTPLDKTTQDEVIAALEKFSQPENTPQGQAAIQKIQELEKENMALKAKERVEMAKMSTKSVLESEKLGLKEEENEDNIKFETLKLVKELAFKVAELEQERELRFAEMDTQRDIAKSQRGNNA